MPRRAWLRIRLRRGCLAIAGRVRRVGGRGLSVERELERAEVPVFASNEPIMLTGGRAQQILQRRINQSVAEYEVLNMLELSWGGTCTHVREGYNIGKPCYGYKAKKIRHANPAKAEKGLTKTRLEPDGLKGETVTLAAKWRYHQQLGCDTIAERLNQDLDKHPPPEPPGKTRARGAWSKSSVADVLKNPKYTGYQVYNRRARRSRGGRNRANPPEMWVWSVEPAHEPLIPKWMFDEFNARSTARQGSRNGAALKKDPRAKRTYRFRGLGLLDALPHLTVNLDRAPAELLEHLFELTQLTVHVHYATDEATLKVTLPADDVTNVAEIGQTMEEDMPAQAVECGKSAGQSLCATCTCPRREYQRMGIGLTWGFVPAAWLWRRASRWRGRMCQEAAEGRC